METVIEVKRLKWATKKRKAKSLKLLPGHSMLLYGEFTIVVRGSASSPIYLTYK